MLAISSTALAILVGATLAVLLLIYRRKTKPSTWTKVGTVSHLYIYPLKSGRYQEVEAASCHDMGFKVDDNLDRIFALAKAGSYHVIDQIDRRKACLVKLNKEDNKVTMEAPQMDNFTFNLPEDFDSVAEECFVKTSDQGIGGSGVCSSAYDCGDEAARWLSRFLLEDDSGLRLLYHHRQTSARTRDGVLDKAFGKTIEEARSHKPAFGNSAPYMVLSEASVDDLNLRLEKPVSHKQFRPNIVVQTVKKAPYQEDQWSALRIGEVVFKFAHPNVRCPVINVEQDSGERDQREPYATLRKYRCILSEDKKAIFGSMEAIIFGTKYGIDEVGEVKVWVSHFNKKFSLPVPFNMLEYMVWLLVQVSRSKCNKKKTCTDIDIESNHSNTEDNTEEKYNLLIFKLANNYLENKSN